MAAAQRQRNRPERHLVEPKEKTQVSFAHLGHPVHLFYAKLMTEPHNPDPPISEEDKDSYFDGPYLVFTEAYHLKRGYCCQSGCRHCPYGFDKTAIASRKPEPETR